MSAIFETALERTLESALPDINETIIRNQEAGYPVANGHSTLQALLATEC